MKKQFKFHFTSHRTHGLKVLLERFYLNGHTSGIHSQTQNLDSITNSIPGKHLLRFIHGPKRFHMRGSFSVFCFFTHARMLQSTVRLKTFTFNICWSLQFTRTVLSSTRMAKESAVFTRSTQTMPVPLMCTVTKLQPVGGGQCSKRDWTAPLISTAAGTTTNEASEI